MGLYEDQKQTYLTPQAKGEKVGLLVLQSQAADDAVQIHGANGYSDEFPVERYLRNSKAPVIYEGTREIHTIMQAEYVLGYRKDKPLNQMLPAWEKEFVTK